MRIISYTLITSILLALTSFGQQYTNIATVMETVSPQRVLEQKIDAIYRLAYKNNDFYLNLKQHDWVFDGIQIPDKEKTNLQFINKDFGDISLNNAILYLMPLSFEKWIVSNIETKETALQRYDWLQDVKLKILSSESNQTSKQQKFNFVDILANQIIEASKNK